MIRETIDGVYIYDEELTPEAKKRVEFLKEAIAVLEETILKVSKTGIREEEIKTQYGGQMQSFSSPMQLMETKTAFQKELNYLIQKPMEIQVRF